MHNTKRSADRPGTPSAANAQPHSHGILNIGLRWLLRSPLHWLVSDTLMLITFTGRKSGKQWTTPVTYVRRGDTIHFFSNQRWWKNLGGGAPVTMWVRGRKLSGWAEPTQDIDVVVAETRDFLARRGVAKARMINVMLDPRQAVTDEMLRAAVQGHVLVFIKLDEERG